MTSRNRKKPLLTAAILLIAVIALFLWYRRSTGPAVKTPRNIIFISIDTCRSDHLSCYGFTQTTTPNIDRLAAKGIQCRARPPLIAVAAQMVRSESVHRDQDDVRRSLALAQFCLLGRTTGQHPTHQWQAGQQQSDQCP